MLEFLRNAWRWLIAKFGAMPSHATTSETSPAKIPRPRRSSALSNVQAAGTFTTLPMLLNGLDDTFKKLESLTNKGLGANLRKYGPFISNLCSTGHGVHGCEGWDSIYRGELEGFKVYGLPSMLFGNLYVANSDEHDYLVFAQKTTKLPYVVKKPGFTYYEYGYVFPKKRGCKIPEFGIAAHVGVNRTTGEVVAIPCRRVKHYRVGRNSLSRVEWCYQPLTTKEVDDKPKHIVEKFCLLYSLMMRREMGVNVVVTRNGCKATFIVMENDWKRFFKDRSPVLATDGRKQRIFHCVVAHQRKTGSIVKNHFRGCRHFTWKDYEVSIVMPGLHGVSQASFGLEDISNEKDFSQNDMCYSDEDNTVAKLSELFGHHGTETDCSLDEAA